MSQRERKPSSGRWRITAVIMGLILSYGGGALAQQPLGVEGFQRASRLSNDEKMQIAARDVKRMKSVLALALERSKQASDDKDFVKINCINDKLSALKGLLKISEQATVSMLEANARSDQELLDHEFTKVSIAAARAENFRVEVEGCVGEVSQYTGSTVVEREVAAEIRSDDPSNQAALALPPIDLDRPAVISPEQ